MLCSLRLETNDFIITILTNRLLGKKVKVRLYLMISIEAGVMQ